MNDRIALITGATQGIGRVAALQIAPSFGTVVLVARDAKRGEETRAAVQAASPASKVELLLGDLSSLADVRRVAAEFRGRTIGCTSWSTTPARSSPRARRRSTASSARSRSTTSRIFC